MRTARLAVAFTLVTCLDACGRSPSTPTVQTLIGTWNGSGSDSVASLNFSWQFSSSAGTPSGLFIALRSGRNYSGTVTGTLSGPTFTFSVTSTALMLPGTTPCGLTMSGSASVTATTISGTYAGRDCVGSFANGRFTLTKS